MRYLGERETKKSLEITFLSRDVERDYLEAPEKIKELMLYVEDKPYATMGPGKPEVLKAKYKGYKGAISRHINAEDRLVYKVVAPGKILILSCKGHYQ